MNKKPTVTIGIPAYNEEANIAHLLKSLMSQKSDSFILEKIVVSSDGSTDKTVETIKALHCNKVILISNPANKGVAARQNQIIKNTFSDILVLLNADISIKSHNFIADLISPITRGEAELTSPSMTEFPPRTFIESILEVGMKLRTILFETWKNGQNGYLCHGTARAFGRAFYTKFRFKDNEGEDMYTYLECLRRQYRFKYIKSVSVWYRNPTTLGDHFKQSARYFKYQAKFLQNYKNQLVIQELKIPVNVYFRGVTKVLPIVIKYPFHVFCYLVIVFIMCSLSHFQFNTRDLWNVSSTKAA